MSFKNRIIFTISFMVVILVITGFISSYLKTDKQNSRFDELAIHSNQDLWDLITLSQYTKMESVIKSITRDRKIKKALKNNDVKIIKFNASTVYNLLEGQKIISNLQIIDINSKVLLDASNPSAENTINKLAQMAIEQKKQLTSINFNQTGHLQTELVFPITSRGKIIGVGSYSLLLSNAIEQLKQRQNSQVYISTIKGDLVSYSEFKVENQIQGMDLPFEQAKHMAIDNQDNIYSTVILPINDITAQLIANIIVLTDSTSSYKSQQKINIFATLMLLLISLLMMIFLYWYINQSLKSLHIISKSLKSVSNGDLTVTIEQNNQKDEIHEIQVAIAETIVKLHALISQITPLVCDVNESSDSLNQAMQKNKSNIGEQKSNIEQVRTAAQNVGNAITNISQFSDEMMANSQDADNELTEGGKIITQTISSINNIADKVEDASTVINKLFTETETIESVLDVIKGIAEQTNLLALNAAIEAARAGESGRGFAVVADEVRSLAGKTQDSTEEIEQMIVRLRSGASDAVKEMKESQKEVSICVDMANKTESSFAIISPKVSDIKDKNIEINLAIVEQKTAIEKINNNISTIDKVAESSVIQNADALQISNNLKQLSISLEELIVQFKV